METLTPRTPTRLLAGLDVGQMADPAALLIMEREMLLWGRRLEPRFNVRFMERVPLRTSYPDLVTGVGERLLSLGEPCILVVDETGVGRGVVDMFRDRAARLTPWRGVVIGVTLTSGEQVTSECWDEWHVPKRTVIMAFQICLQQGRFKVSSKLKDAPTLVKEAQNFQWKVSQAGNDQYGAWREGQHDDLLLGAAITVWWGTRSAPVQAEEGRQQYARATGNPLRRRR